MITDQKILKAVLLLRKCGNTYLSKEEQIAQQKEWLNDPDYAGHFDEWIDSLKEELSKTPEQREEESRRFCEELAEREARMLYEELHGHDREYISATDGDYGPGCPWNAPGMSIRDFI